MDAYLKLNLNDSGKYQSEYLTNVIQNLSKLDSYKDFIFNNINKNLASRVEKLQNLKSRINRIRAILPKLTETNDAIAIKSKKYYPQAKNDYYKFINLQEKPEEITNIINSNYNCTNPNIPKINVKNPLVDKNEKKILGKQPKESLDDCLNYQLITNMQQKVNDLASELYKIRLQNIGSSLDNPLNDLVYEKTKYLDTSFNFMNKKLIQKADQLWKVNKEEAEYKKMEKLEENIPKRTSKKLPSKLQEAPQSIIKKEKIDKYANKKLIVENKEKQEFNLPTSINLPRVIELHDKEEVLNDENTNENENLYQEKDDNDYDFDYNNDINNLNFDDDYDLPVDIITRKNLENFKNDGNMMTPTQNYSYQTANTSNINNNTNSININVNQNSNNNIYNSNYNNNNVINNNAYNSSNNNNTYQTVAYPSSSGPTTIVSGRGPGVPPPPPPPPPPPVVPVVPVDNKSTAQEGKKGADQPGPSMAEEIANFKFKKKGAIKTKDAVKTKALSGNDLLKQQILWRFKNLRKHEEKNNDSDEEEESED